MERFSMSPYIGVNYKLYNMVGFLTTLYNIICACAAGTFHECLNILVIHFNSFFPNIFTFI